MLGSARGPLSSRGSRWSRRKRRRSPLPESALPKARGEVEAPIPEARGVRSWRWRALRLFHKYRAGLQPGSGARHPSRAAAEGLRGRLPRWRRGPALPPRQRRKNEGSGPTPSSGGYPRATPPSKTSRRRGNSSVSQSFPPIGRRFRL